ncbi:MAG: hypothetical protein AAFU50_03995 [Pseudomonadota bacterium]
MLQRTASSTSSSSPSGEDHPRLRAKRGGHLKSAAIGFVAGAAVWNAIGLWSFVSSVVHGVPPESDTGAAQLARNLDGEAFTRLSQSAAAGASRGDGCVALSRVERGLGADAAPCTSVSADLRTIPGVSPRDGRLATPFALQATVSKTNRAPVAGWAARRPAPAPETAKATESADVEKADAADAWGATTTSTTSDSGSGN